MRIQADCVPCLMKRILFQSRLVEGNLDFESVSQSLKSMADNIEYGKKSVDVATKVHRQSYDIIGDDPYLDLKITADEVAERFVSIAEEKVRTSSDPLRMALTVSVIGNIMDFGSGIAIDDPHEFESMFDDLVLQGIESDDTDVVRELLKREGHVTYIFDNCGESQLDRVLIRHLRSMGKRVVGVVRGRPILNDVTLDDALRTGLEKDLDTILTTGKFYVGLDWNDVPSDLMDEIEGSCMIIAKGMANYESLSDEELPVPIVHVLRSKCKPVSDSLGVPIGTNVVRVRMVKQEMNQ